jgi:hypothetical protein
MASLRKKYQPQFESPDKDDGPPVMSPPQGSDARLPDPVAADTAKPPEIEAKSPADQAAESALRQRLKEMDNAEALQREQQQQLPAEPLNVDEPRQPTTEQIINASGLPDRAKDWLRQHPDYVTDQAKNIKLQKMHHVAEYHAGSEYTDEYFNKMDELLGFKQPAPQPTRQQPTQQPAPARQQRAYSGAPISAPPSREVPSMRTGKPQSYRAPLTRDELDIAQASGMTAEQYQTQKERMLRMKQSGEIQNG